MYFNHGVHTVLLSLNNVTLCSGCMGAIKEGRGSLYSLCIVDKVLAGNKKRALIKK